MSKEIKLADTIANAMEDHFFNPAVLARQLSNQPIYTVDKVMELVSYIIKSVDERREVENSQDSTSKGLILAYNLKKMLDKAPK
jgi:hypothetical protein